MGAFLRWYFESLRKRPFVTNIGSGIMLMTMGDVMAQQMERHHVGDNKDLAGVPLNRRLTFRNYYHHHGDIDALDGGTSVIMYDGIENTTTTPVVATKMALEVLRQELTQVDYDYFRTGTMVGFSILYTPVMISFYRFLDLLFPQRTPLTIAARVLSAFLVSIPTNAVFFSYGTSIHHVAEWVAVREEWRRELLDFGLSEKDVDEILRDGPPLDWEMMLAKAALKVNTELYETVCTSGKAWVPINVLNFSVMPAHLRPLVLMFFSVFWNAYLSLVQHRDVALPNGRHKS